MKSTEIRELSKEELVNKELELKDQLFKLKFQHTLGQLENSVKMKTVRRDIARIKTIMIEMSENTDTNKVADKVVDKVADKAVDKAKDKAKAKDKDKGKDKGKGKGKEKGTK